MKKLSAPTCIPEAPVFRGFEPSRDFWLVPGYRRNLPHWRLEGATYFVTFRLADSIPASVVARWQEEEEAWLRERGIEPGWQADDPDRFRQVLDKIPVKERAAYEKERTRRFFIELDQCHGSCLLRLERARDPVASAMHHFHGTRVWLGDFVIMPNHVHLLVLPFPGVRLEEWLYSVKRFSAGQILKDESLRKSARTRAEHVWQTESFDRVVRDQEELARIREYIAANPQHLRVGEFSCYRASWPS